MRFLNTSNPTASNLFNIAVDQQFNETIADNQLVLNHWCSLANIPTYPKNLRLIRLWYLEKQPQLFIQDAV